MTTTKGNVVVVPVQLRLRPRDVNGALRLADQLPTLASTCPGIRQLRAVACGRQASSGKPAKVRRIAGLESHPRACDFSSLPPRTEVPTLRKSFA
ncbi:hypothetical protein MRX96_043140 [Rhipicephalus microplus]